VRRLVPWIRGVETQSVCFVTGLVAKDTTWVVQAVGSRSVSATSGVFSRVAMPPSPA
jgi:hypothetical protein